MTLFRKFFYRKPPDGFLEISDRIFVFDCCFTTDFLEDDAYKVYMGAIVSQLRDNFPESASMAFNFREGEHQSFLADILSEYDMIVMDYPRQYEGCPLLSMEMIHHFLRSSESWLSLSQHNILLMHCERGGWPVLAFMLAGILIYRKQCADEHRTLDMIYKQAPRELLQLFSPLNPMPSQIRYLQYISRRNVGSLWPPLDRALILDCVILRCIPNFDGEGGCRPIFRIYGQDSFIPADRSPKVLFSMPKKSKAVKLYRQADCELAKIDIHCRIQGDAVLECVNLDDDLEHEVMIFRVMFNTALIRSNILILNRDEIDTLWNAKDRFLKNFRAEVLFSEMDTFNSALTVELPHVEGKDGLVVEAFAKIQEDFNNMVWLDTKGDAALHVLQHITASNVLKENQGTVSPEKGNTESMPQNKNSDLIEDKLLSNESYDVIMETSSTISQSHILPTIHFSDKSKANQNATSSLKTIAIEAIPYDHDAFVEYEAHLSVRTVLPTLITAMPETSEIRPVSPKISTSQPLKSLSLSPPPLAAVINASAVTISPLSPSISLSSEIPLINDLIAPIIANSVTSLTIEPPNIPAEPSCLLIPSKLHLLSPPTQPSAPPLISSSRNPSTVNVTSEVKCNTFLSNNVHYCLPVNIEASSITPVPRSLSPQPPPSPSTAIGMQTISSVATLPPPPPPLPLTASRKYMPSITSSPHIASTINKKEALSNVPLPPSPLFSQSTNAPAVKYTGASRLSPLASVPAPPPHQSLQNSSGLNFQIASLSPYPSKGLVLSVGPPPPPTGPGTLPGCIKGQNLSRSMSNSNHGLQTSAKRVSLKPLHWIKVTRAMQGSIWAESQKSDAASKAPEFDMSELESLFSAVPNFESRRISLGQKSHRVQLIDLRRANNCEIMLTKVKIPLSDLLSSVLTLDDTVLDVDQVDNLIKFCPCKEEMNLLKNFNGDKENLGKCEQYFLELMKVPRVESKLRVFSFKIQFRSQVAELSANLNVANSASQEIRNSVRLRSIMQAILSLGNALNHGTARGSAIGFRLDSLLKLTDTRARNNKITLMHYLCKVLSEKFSDLLDFPKDLVSLEHASKIQIKALAEEMQAISRGLEKVEQESAASENDGPVSEAFCKTLKEFLIVAEDEVRMLTSLYFNAGRNADALALYFGEDPARCPFEQVINTLLNFVRMFARANEENCKQLELEKKKERKETEAEKMRLNARNK